MLKFSKISLAVLIALVFAGCIFFNFAPTAESIELTEAEESVEYDKYQSLGDDYQIYYLDGSVSRTTSYLESTRYVFSGSEFIIDVALMNFSDYSAFTLATYQKYYEMFNEVANYFSIFSRGELSVKFNYYVNVTNYVENDFINKETSMDIEFAVVNSIVENGVCLQYEGESDGQCLYIGSGKKIELFSSNKITWPHAYVGEFPSMTISLNSNTTHIVHEIIHMLGCADLYNGDKVARYLSENDYSAPLGSTDIMGLGYNLKTPTTANNRERLGWISTSNYEDNISSGIEIISQEGTYIVNNCDSQSGVLAYKFGIKGNEWFLAEQRYLGDKSYLVIQRINNTRCDNSIAQNQRELYVLSFEDVYGEKYFGSGDSIGSNNNFLYYSDGSTASYYITNIKINNDSLIQFDFYNSCLENVEVNTETPTDDSTTQKNIYVFVDDGYGNPLAVRYIMWYDSVVNAWKSFQYVGVVYIGNQAYYAIFDVPERASVVKFQYFSFNTMSETRLTLNDSTNKYYVVLEKGIVQKTGEAYWEFRQTIENAINSFFELFR